MKLDNIFDIDDEVQFFHGWIFKRDKVLIDNIVFYFHYHASVALYLIACLLVTIVMYIMDPIDCIADKAVDDVIDNFCLYHSTYTISSGAINNISNLFAHPGVPPSRSSPRESLKFHNYYLWVALILAIQASFFYIPRGLWKSWEGSKVDLILNKKNGLLEWEELYSKDEESHQEENGNQSLRNWKCLSNYLLSGSHNKYYHKLLLCELLNFINAIIQLFITNAFLGYTLTQIQNFEFLSLLKETQPLERAESIALVFPKVTACTFFSYGPSGNVINYEALCVLPVNALNEKIFGIIYIWLIMLIVLSFLAVIYRLLFLFQRFRKAIISNHLNTAEILTEDLSLNTLSNNNFGIGNWQLLCQVGGNSNMDSWEFTKIVMHLCKMQT